MPQDRLGLFDTPPDRKQVRFSLGIVGMLLVALLVMLSLPDVRLRRIDAFIPMVDAIMFFGDLVTATLLYVQASVFRSRALTVLATGYVFNALMLLAHVLTFPGAFAPSGLLGAGINTTAWISNAWRVAIPVTIMLYVVLKRVDAGAPPGAQRPAPPIATAVLAAFALAAVFTTLATLGHDLLPSIFLDREHVKQPMLIRINLVLLVLFIGTAIVVFRQRSSILDMWLLVALAGWTLHALLNTQAWARFTVGFYAQFGMLLFANLVIMLALIAETNRLYAGLALSTAARNREREARLMSMDAMAAAISHEVGQPLSAVITNSTGALNWLAREESDPEKVRKALLATIEAGKRATDVIKSIRAMFARKQGTMTEFDLNTLVRETVAMLDRELAGEKVVLRLELDEALPPIRADRVQIQQVLVNLVINAIESLAAARPRPRRLAICTAQLNERDVLLEVSDTGIGIAPEEMARIFQAFFTTKETGTGLGLSLCRTIVEEHGGALWVSPGVAHGATFHLRLPRGHPEAD